MSKSSTIKNNWKLLLVALLIAGTVGVVIYFSPSNQWSAVLAFTAALLSIVLTSVFERLKQRDIARAELYKANLDTIDDWYERISHLFAFIDMVANKSDDDENLPEQLRQWMQTQHEKDAQDVASQITQEGDRVKTLGDLADRFIALYKEKLLQDKQAQAMYETRQLLKDFQQKELVTVASAKPKFRAALMAVNDRALYGLVTEFESGMNVKRQDLNAEVDFEQLLAKIHKRVNELRNSSQ